MSLIRPASVLAALAGPMAAAACDLCAIYRAGDARGEQSSGLTFAIAEQFTAYGTEQFDGKEVHRAVTDRLERSMTHVVAGWNFTDKLGLSLNLPVVHESYRFSDLENGLTPRLREGSETGIGDLAVVLRWQFLDQRSGDWGLTANLLGGVKLPTGDAEHLDELEAGITRYESIVGPGHDHDALGTVVSGVHLHDIALGSGSFDGILGVTGVARWKRGYFNAQAQHYLRTEGAGSYRTGDETILSGGPGAFLWLSRVGTVSLQLNTSYETRGSDEFRGKASVHTGMTAWYAGPQLAFTWKSRYSVLAGVDIPLRAAGRGFQNVPDFRANATLAWRF